MNAGDCQPLLSDLSDSSARSAFKACLGGTAKIAISRLLALHVVLESF